MNKSFLIFSFFCFSFQESYSPYLLLPDANQYKNKKAKFSFSCFPLECFVYSKFTNKDLPLEYFYLNRSKMNFYKKSSSISLLGKTKNDFIKQQAAKVPRENRYKLSNYSSFCSLEKLIPKGVVFLPEKKNETPLERTCKLIQSALRSIEIKETAKDNLFAVAGTIPIPSEIVDYFPKYENESNGDPPFPDFLKDLFDKATYQCNKNNTGYGIRVSTFLDLNDIKKELLNNVRDFDLIKHSKAISIADTARNVFMNSENKKEKVVVDASWYEVKKYLFQKYIFPKIMRVALESDDLLKGMKVEIDKDSHLGKAFFKIERQVDINKIRNGKQYLETVKSIPNLKLSSLFDFLFKDIFGSIEVKSKNEIEFSAICKQPVWPISQLIDFEVLYSAQGRRYGAPQRLCEIKQIYCAEKERKEQEQEEEKKRKSEKVEAEKTKKSGLFSDFNFW